jgi:Protein of unknown function (DUF3237)
VTKPGMDVRFEHVMDLRLTSAAAQPFGQSDYGRRVIVPITGGVFAGPELRGRVIPGGSDWRIARPDGVTITDARYDIETLDGVVIHVASNGICRVTEPSYRRSTIRFLAPAGPCDWLNEVHCIARMSLNPRSVSQRLYKVA